MKRSFVASIVYRGNGGVIYGVYDPVRQEFKYIGQTQYKARDRIKDHINSKSILGIAIKDNLPKSNLWLFIEIPVKKDLERLASLEAQLIEEYNPPLNQNYKNGNAKPLTIPELNELASRLAGQVYRLDSILKEKRKRGIIEFFNTQNIKLSKFGISSITNPAENEVRYVFRATRHLDKILPFIAGDLLAYNNEEFMDILSQEMDADDILGHFSYDALRNYKIAMAAWSYEDRIYDLGISFYQATASLVKINKPVAQEIMCKAIQNGHGRQWVRSEVNKYLPEDKRSYQPTFPSDKLHEMETESYKQRQRIAELEQATILGTASQPIQVSTIISRLSTILDLEPLAAARNIVQIFNELKAIVEELKQL